MAEILAEIAIDVEKALLVACTFKDFPCTGWRHEKTMGGFREGTVALHGRKREKGVFRETGGFFREACDV